MLPDLPPVSVIATYRFVDIDDCEALRHTLLPAAERAGLNGTVLLAPEGARTGVAHVLQLEGGILRYFEQTAGAPHWRGDCIVFDEHSAVDTHGAEAS